MTVQRIEEPQNNTTTGGVEGNRMEVDNSQVTSTNTKIVTVKAIAQVLYNNEV